MNIWKSWKPDHEHCQFVPSSMYILWCIWNLCETFHPSSCQARGLKCFTFVPLHVRQEGWNVSHSSLFMSSKRVEMFHIHPSSCQARGLKCFTFIPLHVKQEGWNVKQTFQIHHKPTFFCSLMVKSKPEWLHPETFIFEAKGYFSCINIDKATKWILQTEY